MSRPRAIAVVLALDVTSFLVALGQTDRSTREVRPLPSLKG